MAAPLTRWHDEHVRFGQILDLLEGQLEAFRAGEEPDYALMRDVVVFLQDYAHRFHHLREDIAFERLAARQPEMRIVANRLLQEHRVIAWAGEELASRLEQVVEDVIVERSAVEAAASTFLVYYRHHLACEETDILPRAARLLEPEDWTAVAAAVPAGEGRDGPPDLEAYLGELRKRLPAVGA